MTRALRPRLLLLAVALLPLLGCKAKAGGACTPGVDDCVGSYYCSMSEVCTRTCTTQADCQIPCTNEGDYCGNSFDRCKNAFCGVTGSLPCIDGYCQRSCGGDGGACVQDAYGPTERNAEGG